MVSAIALHDIAKTMAAKENKWNELDPRLRPFEYFFVDEAFDSHNISEKRLRDIS